MAAGLRTFLTLVLVCVSPMANAEILPDPTLPSIDLNSSGTGTAADVVPDDIATRGLQSIIISAHYRAAIINGETVRLGGKTGDSKLIEVRENSVVLQNAHGNRVLELFPKVSIKKSGAMRTDSGARESTSEQIDLPEQEAGGNK
jgi:MSHA biogenesis protein MshK